MRGSLATWRAIVSGAIRNNQLQSAHNQRAIESDVARWIVGHLEGRPMTMPMTPARGRRRAATRQSNARGPRRSIFVYRNKNMLDLLGGRLSREVPCSTTTKAACCPRLRLMARHARMAGSARHTGTSIQPSKLRSQGWSMLFRGPAAVSPWRRLILRLWLQAADVPYLNRPQFATAALWLL